MEALRVGYRIPFDRPPPLSECPLSLPAYSPHSIRGVALNKELQDLLRKGAVEPAPQSPGFLQPSFPRQEGFGVLEPHHRFVDPERLRHLVTLPHGDSSVSPELHPSRRLDDLPGPARRVSSGSSSSPFASFSSLRGRREALPVQGPLLRSYDRASSLHEDYGTSVHHPPQAWGQDASLPGRLAHPGLFRDRLSSVEGQAPSSLYRTWHPGQSHSWVVEALRVGYRIPFDRPPPLSECPLSLPAYSPHSIRGVALNQELQDLLRKGAVEPAPQSPGFYSRLFLVKKASGSWRPIIDLSTLNDYVTSSRFHMETPRSVLNSIHPGD